MNLVHHTNPVLTTPCEEFDFSNPPFEPIEFAKKLVKFMYDNNGIGLAANQVGVPYRVFAMRGEPENFVCYNPRIVAILFTWRAIAKMRNSINTNLLIMDEVFDSSLDSNGTEEFLKIIKSLTKDTNTFIISHKTDQLYDKFEKVIRFEKYKNFSRVA